MDSTVQEHIPDLQLSRDYGNTLETLLPPVLTDNAEPNTEPSPHVESQTLFLSRRKLNEIPETILRHRSLKELYLEGNKLINLPDSMFVRLPHLVWLDLRNNLIGSLPAGIGSHRYLKTLLLEGNPISELPPELGNVLSLKGLNLRNCPIRSPPKDIVHQGLECILQYLRSAMAERPVSVQRSHPDGPPVEKLRLSALVRSSLESCGEDEEEEEEEQELQRFKELKHKMILLDSAELGSSSPSTTRSQGSLPVVKSQFGRSGKRKTAAEEELKEKQELLEQKKRDQELLQKWRTDAKVMQAQKAARLEQERRENQLKEALEKKLSNSSPNPTQRQQRAPGSHKEQEEARAARDRELEQRIRKQVQMMQERRGKPKGTVKEEKANAEKDMRETLKLQAELLKRKQDREKEYRFTAFTGDI
ncbi:unnamed protein product [Gadus morhua 'NCC']